MLGDLKAKHGENTASNVERIGSVLTFSINYSHLEGIGAEVETVGAISPKMQDKEIRSCHVFS